MAKNLTKAFTLIELLIVIVIIGILAVALIPRLTGAQGMARDRARLADLRQMQTALQMYHNEKGSYPNTFSSWWGNCSGFGGRPTQGLTGYIPGLAPNYISNFPVDPKPSAGKCYIYHSNGKDYNLMAWLTVEGSIPPDFLRQAYYSGATFSVYSSGGKYF